MRTSSAGEAAAPIINLSIRVLVERLLHADPGRRRQEAPALFASPLAGSRLLLIERLIDQLKGKRDAVRRAATDVVADLGPAAVPILVSKLHGARTAEGQLRLVELLVALGRAVPPATRGQIQMDLLAALRRTRSESVAAAIVAAQQQLRRVDAEMSQESAVSVT
jgi:hypothetical protein